MKTNFKRMLAAIVCICMVIGVMPVFAAGFVQVEAINEFWTFDGWNSAEGLPKGVNGGNGFGNIANKTDADGISNLMYVKSNSSESWAYIPFSETVKKGILHLSFNAYVPEGESGSLLIQGLSNAVNNDPLDVDRAEGAKRHPMVPLISINRYESNQVGRALNMNDSSDYMGEPELVELTELEGGIKGSWNKYDVLVDFDSKQISYFMNGMSIGNVWNTQASGNLTAIKSLWIRFMNETYREDVQRCNGICIDNIYVHNYDKPAAGLWDEIQLETDTVNPITAKDGGKLLLSTSEELADEEGYSIMEAQYIDSSLLTVKNALTGEVVDPAGYGVVPKFDGTGLIVEFDGGVVEAGKYEISFADDTYKGRASGKTVASKASFYVNESVLDADNTRRYYLNEDFEGYIGGIPGNWKANTTGTPLSYGRDSVDGKDGGKALQQTRHVERVYYEFDNAIMNGKFTVEFDVLQENSGLYFGLVTAADLMDPERYVGERMGYNGVTGYEATAKNYQALWANEALEAAKASGATIDDEAAWKTNWQNTEFPTKWANTRIADSAEGASLRKSLCVNNINQSFIFGSLGDTWADDALALKYNIAKSTYYEKATWYDESGNTKTAPALKNGTWAHVKLDIDINARKMTAEVDGEKYYIESPGFIAPDAQGSRDLLGVVKVNDIRGVAGTANPPVIYKGGIKGISLGVGSSKIGTVKWDNIKVYTEDSLNLSSDFNNLLIGNHTSSIFYKGLEPSQTSGNWGNNHYVEVENGKNYSTNPSDNALELNAYQGKPGVKNWIFPLDKPVAGGKSFEVELDIKTSKEAKDMFTIGVVASEDMQLQPDKGNFPITATNELKKAMNDHGLISTGVLTKGNDGTNRYYSLPEYPFVAMKDTYYSQNIANQIKTTSGEPINYVQDGTKWYHIKMTVNPTDTDVLCKYEITDGDGKVYTSDFISISDGTTKTPAYYKKGISGIIIQPVVMEVSDGKYVPLAADGSANLASASTQGVTWGGNGEHCTITVDNLKVREVNAEVVKVSTVNATKLDGTSEKLGATLETDVVSLDVVFTGKITNKDAIRVLDINTGEAIDADVELSATGKEATISFESIPEVGTKLVLAVGNNAASYMDAASFGFEIKESADNDIVISEFRLYEYIPARLTEDENDGMWLPLTDDKLTIAAGKNLKLVIKGVNGKNTGENPDLFGTFATYEGDSQRMSYAETGSITPGRGVFELELDNIPLTKAGQFKAFIWEEDGFKPLEEQIVYSVE